MSSLVEKLSEYHIVNFLLPGYFLIIMYERQNGGALLGGDILGKIILAYILGMFVSRLGSLFLEPLYRAAAKRAKILLWADYADYCVAIKTAPRIKALVRDANMYRTFCVVAAVICAYGVYLGDVRISIGGIVVTIIMLAAYAKQNCRIAKNAMQEVGKIGRGRGKK